MQDVGQRAEDIIGAFLKQGMDNVRVYSSWNFDSPQYPLVLVRAGQTEPVVPEAENHEHRIVMMDIEVSTEATPELNQAGSVVRTAREVSQQVTGDVLNKLRVANLATALNNLNMTGTFFSTAYVDGYERTEDDFHLTTLIELECIVHPTEFPVT